MKRILLTVLMCCTGLTAFACSNPDGYEQRRIPKAMTVAVSPREADHLIAKWYPT